MVDDKKGGFGKDAQDQDCDASDKERLCGGEAYEKI